MVLGHSPVLSDPSIPVTVRAPDAPAGVTGGAASVGGVFAGSSHQVLFLSAASDLAGNDANGAVMDLFRRDTAQGRTSLISTNGAGTSGPGQVWDFTVSADGRRVAFTWATDEASLGDTNGVPDIYWRDLETGVTALVSRRRAAAASANGRSWGAQISGDGRWIAFESDATDLVEEPDPWGRSGVFLYDVETGVSAGISRPEAGRVEEDLDLDATAHGPRVSADGSVVAFLSNSGSLAPIEGLGTTAFVWRRGGTRLERVKLPGPVPAGSSLPVEVQSLGLSSDGRILVFPASPGGTPGLWRMDLVTGESWEISQGLPLSVETLVEGPALSADGGTLAFTVENGVDPLEGLSHQVRIWKATSGLHTLESLQEGDSRPVDDPPGSMSPVLSPDGRQLLFLSDAAVPEAGVAVAGALQWFHRELSSGSTRRVSEDPESIAPGFSPDGRHILVEERTPVLVPGDLNEESDLVVVSLAEGDRTVVSLATGSLRTASGGSLTDGGLSDDGGRLAYFSEAPDLVVAPDDADQSRDAFVFHRPTGRNRLVSAGSDGTATGGANEIALARNGRFVAQRVRRDDLQAGCSMVRIDLETGARELVSAGDGGVTPLEGWATGPSISSDGRRVAFRQAPTAEGVADSALYLRDLDTRRTWVLNPAALTGRPRPQGQRLQIDAEARVALFQEARTGWFLVGVTNNAVVELYRFQAFNAWLGADGRTVVIFRQGGAETPRLSLLVLPALTEELLLPGSLLPISDVQIAAQGSVVSYVRRENHSLWTPQQVWVMPVATRVEQLVSRSASGIPGTKDSRSPRLSADGRFVAYRTAAPELVGSSGNAWPQVVVTDRYTGTTTVVSRTDDGIPGNSLSTLPQMSGDGRWVALTTFADNLLPGDANGLGDVMLTRVEAPAPPDTDSDGLADGWEMDHFGSLQALPSADSDGDGRTNADEQAARTSPQHPESNLRLRLDIHGTLWEAWWAGAAGVLYQLEESNPLINPVRWTPVGDPVTGFTGEIRVPMPAIADDADRFVRLVARPAP